MVSSSLGRTFNLRNSILTIALEPGYFHAGTRDLDPSKNSWYAKNPFDTTRVLRYNAFYMGLSITDMFCYSHGPFHTSLELKAGCFPFGEWRSGYVTNTNTLANSKTGGVTVSGESDFTGAVKEPGIPNFDTYVSLGIICSIVTETPREIHENHLNHYHYKRV
jgi:hypothetical protein